MTEDAKTAANDAVEDDAALESDADIQEQDDVAGAEEALLYGVPVLDSVGQTVLFVEIDQYLDLFSELIGDGFLQVIDLCGVDYSNHVRGDLPESVTPERFEVVVNLISHARRERIRVRCQVGEGTEVPSLFDMFPGTEAMEREAFDMFGIDFSNHPDLSRILMPEEWNGFPLRKDFEIGRIPVQFKDAPGQN